MENNNSMRRGVFSNNNERILSRGVVSGDDHQEESGWTMYFDDYFNEYNYNHDHHENSSSMISIGDHLESSLISDAASSAAKKFIARDHHHHHHLDHEQQQKQHHRTCDRSSSLKKRKSKVVLLDDALEDTASSPANSPKVYELMNQFDTKLQQKNIMDISQAKAGGSTSRNLQNVDEIGSGYGSMKDGDNNGREIDTSELKKKGLCLVPLSMIVNYLD